jgi:hypothetical protein
MQASTEQNAPFLRVPAEIRNRIYGFVVGNPTLWISGKFFADADGDPRAGPVTVKNSLVGKGWNWELLLTNHQTRCEFLPFFEAASSLVWYYQGGPGRFPIANALPMAISQHIRELRVCDNKPISLNLARMPQLKKVEFAMGTVVLVCANARTVNALFEEMQNNGATTQEIRFFTRFNGSGIDNLLGDPNFPPNSHITVTASVIVLARLISRQAMVTGPHYEYKREINDQDVTFELNFDWKSGRVVTGTDELARARASLLWRLKREAEVEAMYNAVETASNASEGQIDEWQWQIDDWNHREGELLMTPGREWVFKGEIAEIKGKNTPDGH